MANRRGFSYSASRGKSRPASPSPDAYQPPTRKQPAPMGSFRRWRIPFTVLLFTSAGLLSFSLLSNNASPRALQQKEKETPTDVPEDVSDRYHALAAGFDKEIGTAEMFMGMGWLRKWLTREASGHVLEMGVGTGRNSRHYPLNRCKSITMIDQAPEMVEIARAKFKSKIDSPLLSLSPVQLQRSFDTLLLTSALEQHPAYAPCRFVTQSAHEQIQHPPDGFDTIIQTMGICSTAHPATALQHLGNITNPDHGRILLLEHGRSHYQWLNDYLDRYAAGRAEKFGCWWNKDIGKVVEESGLEVVRIKRYHFGTTWWVELKPKHQKDVRAAVR